MIPGQKKGEMRISVPSAEGAVDRLKDLLKRSERTSEEKRTMKLELLLHDEALSIDKLRERVYDYYKWIFGIPDNISAEEYSQAARRTIDREEMGLLPNKKDDTIVYLYNRMALERKYDHISERDEKYRRWAEMIEREDEMEKEQRFKDAFGEDE